MKGIQSETIYNNLDTGKSLLRDSFEEMKKGLMRVFISRQYANNNHQFCILFLGIYLLASPKRGVS